MQQQFERQLSFLQRFGTFIDADEAAAKVDGGWPGNERAFLLTFDDGQADTVDVALPILRRRRIPAIQFIVSDWLDTPPQTGRRDGFMNRDDVKTWLDAGLKIGSHTADHRRLSGLDAETIGIELTRSREALGALAGTSIAHFACPWGMAEADYDPHRDPDLARQAGYTTFFTTRRGRATGRADLMSMPRHVLEPHWSEQTLQTLLGGWKHARA